MASAQVPKVAVVGCGYWGKNLVRNFHKLGALAAICDSDAARVREMAQAHKVRAIEDFDELLKVKEIGAVVISAPAALHYSLSKRALLAGKDVFVEKPLALRVEEGEELAELAKKQDRIMMVGHLLQYHPAILELKRLISEGELGRVQYIYSSRLNLGKLRTEEDILWSFAPHDLSAILYLLDEEPVSVAAHGSSYLSQNVVDVTLTTCEFSGGVKAHIFVSWIHPFKEQKLVIVGDRKMAVFDDTESDRKLVIYPHRIDWIDRRPVAHKSEGTPVALPAQEPLALECQHFLECVQGHKNPRTDGENGVRVLRILDACEQSLKEKGKPLQVHPAKPGYFVHPSAAVDNPAEIGEGTKIWHFSHVMPGTKIGKRCILGQNVHVAAKVRIGDNVKIQNNVSLYEGVEIEDDVFCGPSMVFTNVTNPRSHVSRKHEYRRTLIKRGASLGANSTIVCGHTVGQYAFVAAGGVVTRDVPDHALVIGVPARQVGWMCRCGVRLQFTGREAACQECGDSYYLNHGRLLLLPKEPIEQTAPVAVRIEASGLQPKTAIASEATTTQAHSAPA
ncbi:MAG TPA: Gfo/Idh/MocA family oxidoreductase [Candidatus Acidoferrales bacterium]|nr:Gfo/Idh/MocA family oxidoreductase [Candidatus Acidoferrales bacterium]